jgi:hypothetical protein
MFDENFHNLSLLGVLTMANPFLIFYAPLLIYAWTSLAEEGASRLRLNPNAPGLSLLKPYIE